MAKTGYLAKAALIYALCFGDLIINGVADHNQVPGAASWIPFVWIGCVCVVPFSMSSGGEGWRAESTLLLEIEGGKEGAAAGQLHAACGLITRAARPAGPG